MKKIYMILAAISLLSMSLNAQNAQTKLTASTKGQPTSKMAQFKRITFNDMVRGIKGMSSILPESNPNGNSSSRSMRAPLMINSDEFTIGPFEGDNFGTDNGLGLGDVYPNAQDIRLATILQRSEFAQHDGEQIIGFRFGLAGQTSTNNQVKVYDFFSWPSSANGYFENANRHTWNLGDFGENVITDYQLINDDLTSSNFSTGTITTSAPWTATSVSNQSNGSFYITSYGNLKFTVPEGYNNADFKFTLMTRDSYYSGTFTFTPSNGSAQTLTTSAANTEYSIELNGLSTGDVITITGKYNTASYSPDFTYMHVYAKGGAANYLTLTGGQWYEYYLDEPIDFVVNDSIDELWLGYTYEQFPSSSTNELRFPIGVNSASTTHQHAAWLYYPNSSNSGITITVPGNTVNFSSIRVYDTSNNLLTSWYSSSTNTGTVENSSGTTSTYYIMPTGWSIDGAYMFQYGSSGSYTGYVSTSSNCNILISSDILGNNSNVNVVISAYDDNGGVTMTVNGEGKTISNSTSGSYTWSNVSLTTTNYEYGLYGFDFSQYGDLAVQLIFKSQLPKTATPTINVVTNADGSKTISATGDGTVHLYVDGVEVTNPYTIPASTDGDITYTVTATAQEDGKQISDTATEIVTVAEAGRSPMPTITFTDNGDGTYTITATGTGEVALYINDAEHGGTSGDPILTGQGSVSMTVEQHSQAMTIPVQATNQEGNLLVSHTAEATYTIPAMTIDNTFQTLDPQPANASTPIDMSKLMFCDRFTVDIPIENNHPRLYDYYLQETQVRQRTSNSVEVPVKHTGSDGLGFYSLKQIDNDIDRKLKMNVRNAAMDLPLEADPNVYYYTESRGTVAYPDQAGRKYLAVLQRTSDGFYNENLTSAYDYGVDPYPGGKHHIHYDLDTITGEYNQYLTYVPIVWTMGFDRVNYPTDHEHNSYGAPKWKTGVADVIVNSVDAEKQINSASTTWNDNGKTNMYMLTVDATGFMPTVNTMPYEPYMFRVFVESQNGKLRGWKYVEADSVNHIGSHYEAAEGSTEGPICVWSEYVKNSPYITQNGNEVYFVKTKVEERDPVTNQWVVPRDMNIMFAALDDLTTETHDGAEYIIEGDLKIYVRFYYIVEGSAANHNPVVPTRDGEGDAPAGYGSESPGTSPSPSTGVKEIDFCGDVVSTTYYNVQGISSTTPFDGINIVVTRYSNGTTRTTKVVR